MIPAGLRDQIDQEIVDTRAESWKWMSSKISQSRSRTEISRH